MKLSQLKKELPQARTLHFQDCEIKGVTCDSQSASKGHLFIAINGEARDGHQFALDAVRNGAAAVVAERKLDLPESVPQVIVEDTREAAALLAAKFHGYPSELLSLVGVTGTNGKTTTTWMLKSIIEAAGKSPGLIGTIHYESGGRCIPAKNTTPSAIDTNRMLREMYQAGQEYAVMEVSSHSLIQRRVHGLQFAGAVFTNLTDNEHLDYHKTFEAYREAKCMLFEGLSSACFAAINLEDPCCGHIASRTKARVVTYAVTCKADVRAIVLNASMSGTRFELHSPQGSTEIAGSFFGRYNISNAAAAATAALQLGIGIESVRTGLEQYEGTPGRLEVVDCGQSFSVLVDYAHSPDALANVLTTLREVAARRIILVFGCGGDRDRGKRPVMGGIAKQHSDYFVITADNSRKERTDDIIAEIEAGIGQCSYYDVQPDRSAAIRLAIASAKPGDIVLLAGKGHETYQILGDTIIPFDDREQARAALTQRQKVVA